MTQQSNQFLQVVTDQITHQGLSYRNVAKQAGLSHSQLNAIIAQKQPMTFQTCLKLADWLQMEQLEAVILAGMVRPVHTDNVDRLVNLLKRGNGRTA